MFPSSSCHELWEQMIPGEASLGAASLVFEADRGLEYILPTFLSKQECSLGRSVFRQLVLCFPHTECARHPASGILNSTLREPFGFPIKMQMGLKRGCF